MIEHRDKSRLVRTCVKEFVFLGANPAVHYISCGEPRHKRMPFPSGLGHTSFPNISLNKSICIVLRELYSLVFFCQRIKIHCYNTNRSYRTFTHQIRAVGSPHIIRMDCNSSTFFVDVYSVKQLFFSIKICKKILYLNGFREISNYEKLHFSNCSTIIFNFLRKK